MRRFIVMLGPVVLLVGCGNVCKQAADYRFECGEPSLGEATAECGNKTEAACEAACDLEADCIIFGDTSAIPPDELARYTNANGAQEDCLAGCEGLE